MNDKLAEGEKELEEEGQHQWDPWHQPLLTGLQRMLYLSGSGTLPKAIIGGE